MCHPPPRDAAIAHRVKSVFHRIPLGVRGQHTYQKYFSSSVGGITFTESTRTLFIKLTPFGNRFGPIQQCCSQCASIVAGCESPQQAQDFHMKRSRHCLTRGWHRFNVSQHRRVLTAASQESVWFLDGGPLVAVSMGGAAGCESPQPKEQRICIKKLSSTA